MDNTMVKRGIGAVVLAIIAALLLGYLLKDKSRERQDVVEMSLPGTAGSKIPSLSETTENAGTVVADGTVSAIDGANNIANNGNETGAKVVAAVAGAGMAATATAGNAGNSAGNAVANAGNTANQAASNIKKPGFSIRPAAPNEQRNVVDLNAKNTPNQGSTGKTNKSASNAQQASGKSGNRAVVASASGKAQKDTYRPRLIKERKKTTIVSSTKNSDKQTASNRSTQVVSSSNKKAASKSNKKSASTSKKVTASKSAGRYAIQLMATSSQSRAKKLKNTMRSEGYVSYVTKTSRNNKVLYRVRIGVKGNRNSAISFQAKMKRRYRKNFFVQNSLVVAN